MPYVPGVSTDPVEEAPPAAAGARRKLRSSWRPATRSGAPSFSDEMCRKDQEQATVEAYSATARRIVPSGVGARPGVLVLRGPQRAAAAYATVLMALAPTFRRSGF